MIAALRSSVWITALAGVVSLSACSDSHPLIGRPNDPEFAFGWEERDGLVTINFDDTYTTTSYYDTYRVFRAQGIIFDRNAVAVNVVDEFPGTWRPWRLPPTSGRHVLTMGDWDFIPYPYGPSMAHTYNVTFTRPVSDFSFNVRAQGDFSITCYNASAGVVDQQQVIGKLDADGKVRDLEWNRSNEPYPLKHVVLRGTGITRCEYSGNGGIIDDVTFRPERDAPATVTVECQGDLGKNSVTRGEAINCSIRTDPPGRRISVDGWWFTGTDSRGTPFRFPTADDTQETGASWSGRMAISGDVFVRASVDGALPQEYSTRVEVRSRNWQNAPVEHQVGRISLSDYSMVVPTGPKAVPAYPRNEHDLGRTLFQSSVLVNGDAVEYITDFGPNHGLAFLKRVPVELDIGVMVHPEIEQRGEFFRKQRASAPAYSSSPPCVQSSFSRFEALILAHEGWPVNAQSHTGVYLREYGAAAGPAVEELSAPNDALADLQDLVLKRLEVVGAQANAVSDAEVDGQHAVPFGCYFNFGR